MPLQRVKFETTSTELLLWKVYLEKKQKDDWEQLRREDFYLAQIAMEVRRVWYALIREKMKEKLDVFMFDFKPKKKQKSSKEMSQTERQLKLADSKRFWGAFVEASKGPSA